jgi:hypothetical protein
VRNLSEQNTILHNQLDSAITDALAKIQNRAAAVVVPSDVSTTDTATTAGDTQAETPEKTINDLREVVGFF